MPIIHIEHTVRDYDRWKASFDADPMDRKGSGVRRYRVSRATDNPDHVMIDLELDTATEADALLAGLQGMWPQLEGVLLEPPKAQIFDVLETQEL